MKVPYSDLDSTTKLNNLGRHFHPLSSTFTFFHPGGLPWSVVLNAQTFLWIGMDGLLYASLLEAALCCAYNEVDGYINAEFSPVWCKAALGRMCNCHLK